MTWEELCEKAKEIGAEIVCEGKEHCEALSIDDNVYLKTKLCLLTDGIETIHINAKSYSQMYLIMEALRMKDGIIETAEDMQKIRKIEQLQKKLDIAVKALDFYKKDVCGEPYISRIATETLKEIDLVGTSAKEEV